MMTNTHIRSIAFPIWVLCALLNPLAVHAVEDEERPLVASRNLFGACPNYDRGCFFGLFGVTMFRMDGDQCQEKCVLFPRVSQGQYECGPCPTIPGSSPSPGFSITMAFDNVPASDYGLFEKGAARWERIITSDFPEVSTDGLDKEAPGCVYPGTIDDIYMCIYYGDINDGDVAGLGGYSYLRTAVDGGPKTPLVGWIRLKKSMVPVGKEEGWLPNLVLHEMGHALGIGLVGDCPSDKAKSKANLEYQAISGCTASNVPTEDGCGHFQEDCLADEIMTPYIGSPNYISRLSLGWLEDIGYSVNYDASDKFDGSMLGTNPNGKCNCKSSNRPLVRELGSEDTEQVPSKHRQLSKKGYDAAVAYGRAHLQEQSARRRKSGSTLAVSSSSNDNVEFVGDQMVSVYYMESGTLHSVTVRQGQ